MLAGVLPLAAALTTARPQLRLWNSGVWPYAQRPWIALLETGAEFEHEIIDLAHKPARFLDLYARASGGSAGAKVPLLETADGGAIVESIDVARHIAVGSDLYPPGDSGRVDDFVRLWCGTVEGAYYDVLRAQSEPQARFAVAGLSAALSQVEESLWQQRMTRSWRDAGSFLLGEGFSLAEVVAAPWVERMALMLPYWRSLDLYRLCAANGLTLTADWLRAVLARPSVQTTSAGEAEMAAAARKYFVSYVSPGAPGEEM